MSRTITYRGPAPLVSALAQMLREEGAQVDYTRPEERKGTGVELVLVYIVVKKVADKAMDRGLDAIIDSAVKMFRDRFGGTGAHVKVDDDE